MHATDLALTLTHRHYFARVSFSFAKRACTSDLSDVDMPGMSGCELIAELRKLPQTANTPAIALTGFGRVIDVAEALRAGFDAYVGKPVSLV
ncbi:response regulator [Paraburkholderia phytofirmans]|uniref:response regulator n=1 Tax=Paraburkholderia phytofirmans TaxID=261302 RepID=UPI0038BC4A7C